LYMNLLFCHNNFFNGNGSSRVVVGIFVSYNLKWFSDKIFMSTIKILSTTTGDEYSPAMKAGRSM